MVLKTICLHLSDVCDFVLFINSFICFILLRVDRQYEDCRGCYKKQQMALLTIIVD